jgi:hypothetical protein
MPKDPLQLANEALDKAIETEKRNKAFMASVGPAIVNAITPTLNAIRNAVSNLRVDVAPNVNVSPEIRVPDVDTSGIERVLKNAFSDFKLPENKINIPKIELPKMQWPDEDMPIRGEVSLMGINLNSPLPVQLRDANGKPVSLNFDNLNISGGSGGGMRHVVVDKMPDITTSPVLQVSGASDSVNIIQSITLETVQLSGSVESVSIASQPITLDVKQVSGSSDSVNIVNANTLDVQIVSGAIVSVNNQQTAGNPTVVGSGYQDNALRVVHATDAVVSVNIVSENQTLEVKQVSGSADSVNVSQFNGNTAVSGGGYQDNAIRVVHATDAVLSVNIVGENQTLEVIQLSGSVNSVSIALQPTTLDVKQVSGSVDSVSIAGNIATLDVQIVSGASSSVNNVQWNGNPITVGTGYQDNALRVVHATDAVVSVNIVSENVTLEVIQVSGGVNSVQSRLLARTTNPTAASDATPTFQGSDKLGRAITRPIQVRELLATAYASVSNGTEATLLTAAAGTYLDCIWIGFANTSNAAVQVDIRAVSGGNIVSTIEVPASGTSGWAPPVPWPQDATGNAWTVDGPDITGSTFYVNGLFSKET